MHDGRQVRDALLRPVNRKGRHIGVAVSLCWIALAFCVRLCAAVTLGQQIGDPSSSGPTVSNVLLLSAGQRIDRELGPRQVDIFRIALDPGSAGRISIDQRSVDVTVSISDEEGRVVREIDVLEHGFEVITLNAVDGTAQLLRIRRVSPDSGSLGPYAIVFESARPMDPVGLRRISAEVLSTEARRQIATGTAASMREAEAKLGEVLPLWKTLEAHHETVHVLRDLGYVLSRNGHKRDGLAALDDALALTRDLQNGQDEARVLEYRGEIQDDLGELRPALETYKTGLSIAAEVGDRQLQAGLLLNMAIVENRLGERENGLELYARALPLYREIGDRVGEGLVVAGMARINDLLGRKQIALDFYHDSLELRKAVGDLRGQAQSSSGLGLVYASLGDTQRAIDYLAAALRLYRESGDQLGEAATLTNLGTLADNRGDNTTARDYLERAVALQQSLGDRFGQANALTRLGRMDLRLAAPGRALERLSNALVLRREVGDRSGEGTTLLDIARAHLMQRETDVAVARLTEALAIFRAVSDPINEAAALATLARAERDRGHLDDARAFSLRVLDLSERVRAGVLNDRLKTAFLAAVRDYFELHIDILMRLHVEGSDDTWAEQALQAAERARARSLMDSLAEGHALIRQGVDSTLLDQEQDITRRINASAEHQRVAIDSKASQETLAAARTELDTLLDEQQTLQARIRAASPAYAALVHPVPLTLREIQEQVLDEDTLLLEYALGEEHSYGWVVSRYALTAFRLPARAEIEGAARHFYERLTQSKGNSQASAGWDQASLTLERLILEPLRHQLTRPRLLVVADGGLQYIPFAALRIPSEVANSQQWLATVHEVISVPSASVLAVMRTQLQSRPRAGKELAVLADPVFHETDARVDKSRHPYPASAQATIDPQQLAAEVDRVTSASRLRQATGRLPRLPFTRREAESILSLVPAPQRLKAVDFDASRTLATSGALGDYRLVHIATHAVLNTAYPELTGLVLSLVDAQGEPQPGVLRLTDIYNLRLTADLIVLSACETALGKDIKSEGLVGMTRGFMYAGAARVVVSLWQVDDEATAALMTLFYRNLLRSGMTPAAALRAAQLSISNQTRWRSPYYWAAFVIQGEYR